MQVSKIIAIAEVKDDLDAGENFYESRAHGVGGYFRESLIHDW